MQEVEGRRLLQRELEQLRTVVNLSQPSRRLDGNPGRVRRVRSSGEGRFAGVSAMCPEPTPGREFSSEWKRNRSKNLHIVCVCVCVCECKSGCGGRFFPLSRFSLKCLFVVVSLL